jgi:hypothetical protein
MITRACSRESLRPRWHRVPFDPATLDHELVGDGRDSSFISVNLRDNEIDGILRVLTHQTVQARTPGIQSGSDMIGDSKIFRNSEPCGS